MRHKTYPEIKINVLTNKSKIKVNELKYELIRFTGTIEVVSYTENQLASGCLD